MTAWETRFLGVTFLVATGALVLSTALVYLVVHA